MDKLVLTTYLDHHSEDRSHHKDLCQDQYQEYRQVVDQMAVVFLVRLRVMASLAHRPALASHHHRLLLLHFPSLFLFCLIYYPCSV